jgi:hypothetical protein
MVSDCCLMLNEQFVSYIIGEQVTFRWDIDFFVQDQHALLDFYSA